MRKDIENELLKYGMEVKLLNKSELARRMNCSRQTINAKLKRVDKQNTVKKRIYMNQMQFLHGPRKLNLVTSEISCEISCVIKKKLTGWGCDGLGDGLGTVPNPSYANHKVIMPRLSWGVITFLECLNEEKYQKEK